MPNIPLPPIEIQLSNNSDGYKLSSQYLSNKSITKPDKTKNTNKADFMKEIPETKESDDKNSVAMKKIRTMKRI